MSKNRYRLRQRPERATCKLRFRSEKTHPTWLPQSCNQLSSFRVNINVKRIGRRQRPRMRLTLTASEMGSSVQLKSMASHDSCFQTNRHSMLLTAYSKMDTHFTSAQHTQAQTSPPGVQKIPLDTIGNLASVQALYFRMISRPIRSPTIEMNLPSFKMWCQRVQMKSRKSKFVPWFNKACT